MCVLFYSLFACISAYANVIFKMTIIKQNIQIILIAGVPMSQAFPGYLITAPPSVCVPDVIGALAVWIQNQKKKKKETGTRRGVGHRSPGIVRHPKSEPIIQSMRNAHPT